MITTQTLHTVQCKYPLCSNSNVLAQALYHYQATYTEINILMKISGMR